MSKKSLKEQLNEIGASYFVSYLYGKYIDKAHKNYKKRKTSKIAQIEKLKESYDDLISLVLQMDPDSLETNEIGLSGERVLQMAEKLKTLFSNNSAITLHVDTDDFVSFDSFSRFLCEFNVCLHEFENRESSCNANENEVNYICDFKKGSIIFDFIIKIAKEKLKEFFKFLKEHFAKDKTVDINIGDKKNILKKNTEKIKIEGSNISIGNSTIYITIYNCKNNDKTD